MSKITISSYGTCLVLISLLFSGHILAQEVPSNITSGSGEPDNKNKLDEASYIQSQEKDEEEETVKSLSLNAAIEQGLRKNFGEQIRKYRRERLEINWEDTHTEYWYPSIELNLQANPHGLGTLHEGTLPGDVASEDPTGNISLGFDDYTVFNWGKDYLSYLNSKDNYERDKEILNEERRELRHNVLKRYFELTALKEIEDIFRQQLRHASYIYNLNREKVTLGKLPKREYHQARSEYLRAQTEFDQARNEVRIAEQALAEVLIDQAGTQYTIAERIDYRPLNIKLPEARKLAKQNNPRILTSQKDLRVSNRQYDIAKRDNLPLPEFNVDLGAYDHSFGPQASSTRYRTAPNSSDIELVASINATWSIFGDGGLLNSRDLRDSYLDKLINERELREARHQTISSLRTLLQRIRHNQRQIRILNAREVSLQKTFNTVLESYMDGQTDFQDLRQALLEKTQVEALKARTYYLHMQNKIDLAGAVGVEDFPGENFEDQVVQE